MPRWQRHLARASHFALYLLILAIPVSGWLYSSATGVPTVYLGWVQLPDLGYDGSAETVPAGERLLFIAPLIEGSAGLYAVLLVLAIAAVAWQLLRGVTRAYVGFFRGTPLFVQILLVHFALMAVMVTIFVLAARAFAVGDVGLAFGQRGGVEQHHRQQAATRLLREDGAAEAALDQQRNAADMVDVRVAEYQRIERTRLEAERFEVACLGGLLL